MIDTATTLFCTLMALYVCIRAVKLDRLLPWFETRAMFEAARARLARAQLARAQLTGAQLTGAQLTGAQLTGGSRTGMTAAAPERGEPGQDVWRAGTAAPRNPYSASQRQRDPRWR